MIEPNATVNAKLPSLLVVDDESAIRRAVQRSMSAEYEVVTVASGQEAIDAIVARGGGFDVILSDMWMPRMTGPQMRDLVCKEFPVLRSRFLFMTGALPNLVSDELAKQETHLDKPFTLDNLRRSVRAIRDAITT
jgi:DNA-binding NtrC family response regulator